MPELRPLGSRPHVRSGLRPRVVVVFALVLGAVVAGGGAASTATLASRPSVPPARTVLRINSGVGYRQFLRVATWLSDNLLQLPNAPRPWLSYHRTGAGFRDAVLELENRQAEISLINARSVAAMAVRGRGLFDHPVTVLRGIAAVPHYDWAMFAVDASLGVHSFEEVRAKKVALVLTTGALDGDNAVGFICTEILRRHGITLADLKQWGGGVLETGIGGNREDVLAGRANAVCQEGARGEEWDQLFRKKKMNFLSIDAEVATAVARDVGFGTLTVPASYYPGGQDNAFVASDFSDWILCVRADMDEAMAYALAKIVIEQRQGIDKEYGSENPRFSSVNVPTVPAKLADTAPVPLHPGAARYYREHGLAK